MHPELSKQLFEEAVGRIVGNSDLLVERGWLVLASTYPELTVGVRHRRTGRIRVFRFLFDDWNDLPPRLTLLDGETLEELPGAMWPKSGTSHWHASGWTSAGGISSLQPFMCMQGIREYHTHQSHFGDSWENYKPQSGFDLGGIISKVTEVFQKSDV